MNQELTQTNNMNLQKLFEEKQKEIGEMAKEIAEREFEILEFNLFVSSAEKERLNKVSKEIRDLRIQIDSGKISFEQYEKIAEQF